MKKLAISLPDDVYVRIRIKAAERDTSVNALVRQLLIEFAEVESDFERRKQLQDDVIASIRHFHAADRVSRNEVHERKAARKRSAS